VTLRLREIRTRTLGAVAGVLTVAFGLLGAHTAGASSSTPAPLTIYGEGSWDVAAEATTWHNGLYTATAAHGAVVDDYTANGDGDGIGDFLAGSADYLISGVPLSAAQAARLPGGRVIAAPILSTGLAFMLAPPSAGPDLGFNVQKGGSTPVIPYGPPPLVPSNRPPFFGPPVPFGSPQPDCPTTGCPPVNVPATNLVAMLDLDYGDPSQPTGLYQWSNPSILETWNQPALDLDMSSNSTDVFNPTSAVSPIDSSSSPFIVLRADPNDDNYYLQQWILSQAPSIWAAEGFSGPSSLSLPPTYGSAFVGVGLQEALGTFQAHGQRTGNGLIAYVPPSGLYLLNQIETAQPTTVVNPSTIGEFIGIQNANGDYVVPTPSSVSAAVSAGADAGLSACDPTNQNALYAMTHKVAGAYPLAWVDCLYAPAKGLSIAKTNAVAGLIRYRVTDGQLGLSSRGDAALPASYVLQSLAAANDVVDSNCPVAGGQVVVTNAAPTYGPTDAGVAALGPVDQCLPAPPKVTAATTTTTTTVPAATTTTAPTTVPGAISTGSTPAPTGSAVTPVTSTPPSAASGPVSTTTTTVVGGRSASGGSTPGSGQEATLAAKVATNLPYPLNSTPAQNLDKLTALLLGGVLFLLARRGYRALARAFRI